MSNDPNAGYPIPQTDALRQASKTSLVEMFSTDPENMEMLEVIMAMRDLRDRLAATTVVRQVRVKKDTVMPRLITDPSDIGL
jgi:hypothetical protein